MYVYVPSVLASSLAITNAVLPVLEHCMRTRTVSIGWAEREAQLPCSVMKVLQWCYGGLVNVLQMCYNGVDGVRMML